jgi:hypothetical protein
MKRLALLVLVVVLVLSLPLTALAKGGNNNGKKVGPAKKANGGVTLAYTATGGYFKIGFTAEEAKGGQPAKGQMSDSIYAADGTLVRELHFQFKYVRIDGNKAYFAGPCTADSDGTLVGSWLYVKVEDGGTPGTAGDFMGWAWAGDEAQASAWVAAGPDTAFWEPATAGNLTVHNK